MPPDDASTVECTNRCKGLRFTSNTSCRVLLVDDQRSKISLGLVPVAICINPIVSRCRCPTIRCPSSIPEVTNGATISAGKAITSLGSLQLVGRLSRPSCSTTNAESKFVKLKRCSLFSHRTKVSSSDNTTDPICRSREQPATLPIANEQRDAVQSKTRRNPRQISTARSSCRRDHDWKAPEERQQCRRMIFGVFGPSYGATASTEMQRNVFLHVRLSRGGRLRADASNAGLPARVKLRRSTSTYAPKRNFLSLAKALRPPPPTGATTLLMGGEARVNYDFLSRGCCSRH